MVDGAVHVESKELRHHDVLNEGQSVYHQRIYQINTPDGNRTRYSIVADGEEEHVTFHLDKEEDTRRTSINVPPAPPTKSNMCPLVCCSSHMMPKSMAQRRRRERDEHQEAIFETKTLST